MKLIRRLASLLRPRPAHRVLFAFTGGSAVWPAMGRELYRTERVFREAIDETGAVIETMLGFDAAARFRGQDDSETTIELARRNEVLQIGMLQLAQVDLWRDAGVTPGGTFGVSLGEMVAPYAAGAITRTECARVLGAVSDAISRSRSDERMFIVNADAATAQRIVRTASVPLHYLGSMTPTVSVVLSEGVDAAAARAFLGSIVAREIETDWSYHTPRLDVGRELLRERLAEVRSVPAQYPVYSSAAGGPLPPGAPFDAQFFAWMVTRPFRYADALTRAFDDGFDVIVNLGPRPANNLFIKETARTHGRALRLIDSMRLDADQSTWQHARASMRTLRVGSWRARPVSAATLGLTESASGTNLFESYEALRKTGLVHQLGGGSGAWIVLGYEDVQRALADSERFSSRVPSLAVTDPVLLGNDPPEHTVMRRIVAAYFSTEANARRVSLAESAAEELLQRVMRGGEFDAVHDFANPLSDMIAGDLVGLDAESVATLYEPTLAAGGGTMPLYANLKEPLAALAPRSTLYAALREEVDEPAAQSLLRLLWISAKTPRRSIALAILLLLEHPHVREAIATDPQLLGAFVDEALRLRPPAHVLPRITTADVELGGKLIRRGSTVHLCLAAANRDPARFARPAELRLDRSPNPHLSFGAGVHRCVGGPLGRQQVIAALRALFRVAPNFHAVQPFSTLRYAAGAPQRELEELVVGL